MKRFTVPAAVLFLLAPAISKPKVLAAAIALGWLTIGSIAQAQPPARNTGLAQMSSLDDARMVAPALVSYTKDHLLADVWKRPGLALRDRSIITIAALIARNQTSELPYYLNLALENGVKPKEISETLRTWHSMLAGEMPWRRSRSQKGSLLSTRSALINFRQPCPSSFLSMRLLRLNERLRLKNSSVPSRQASSNTPLTCYSETCGCARTSRPGTAAW